MLTSLYQLADFARHQGRARSGETAQETGKRGEDIAHRFLQRSGMTVVARNYRTSTGSGEIDLIAWENDTLVFVEVKCRATAEYGPPDRAIDTAKERKIVRAAEDYARRADIPWDRIRFDTVGVVLNRPPYVEHQKDVFTVRTVAGV